LDVGIERQINGELERGRRAHPPTRAPCFQFLAGPRLVDQTVPALPEKFDLLAAWPIVTR